MSRKKRASKRQRPRQSATPSRHKSKAVIIVGLMLCTGLTTLVLAQWSATRVAGRTNALLASPVPTPTSTPLQLSKEYIYAGGKLVATEELAAAATPTPTPTATPTPTPSRTNYALDSNGGTASASSSYGNDYLPAHVNNGDEKGPGTNSLGDYWNDSTPNTFGDTVQVQFNGTHSINEIDLFMLQDTYWAPTVPNETMNFTYYGLTSFDVQYWNGSSWTTVPDGQVTGNTHVWRKFTFNSVTTDKVRVVVNGSVDGYSRLVEFEAWGEQASPADTNVALSTNGATASASSSYGSGYLPEHAINGDKKGPGPNSTGDYWNSGTVNSFPEWLQVEFPAQKTIHEIDLYCLQDIYWSPSEPTPTMAFTYYGLRDFEVQYWTGSAWVAVSGGQVTGNDKVWRKFMFPDLTTQKIRVLVTATPDGWSRVTELEAWGH